MNEDERSNYSSEDVKLAGNFVGAPFLWSMLAIVIAGIARFTYGAGLDHAFVGWGFCSLSPSRWEACLQGPVPYLSAPWGCLGAPVILFAVIFAVVNLGFGEGLICIAMVMPFWIAAGAGGGLAALLIANREKREADETGAKLKVSALLVIPFALIYVEEVAPPQWQTRAVERSVVISADAKDVWPMLLTIPDISQDEGIATFTHDIVGLARPSTARLEQRGDTQVRVGHWGEHITFEEHVTQRIEGERVAWRFEFPDNSVQIYTDKHIDPDGPVLKVATGAYTLEELGSGETRVALSTNYRMRTRLGWYFGLWGEIMLSDVHDNVLAIIKQRAESR